MHLTHFPRGTSLFTLHLPKGPFYLPGLKYKTGSSAATHVLFAACWWDETGAAFPSAQTAQRLSQLAMLWFNGMKYVCGEQNARTFTLRERPGSHRRAAIFKLLLYLVSRRVHSLNVAGESVDKCTKAYLVFQLNEHCFDSLKRYCVLRANALSASLNGKYYLSVNACDGSGHRRRPLHLLLVWLLTLLFARMGSSFSDVHVSLNHTTGEQLLASTRMYLFICSIGVYALHNNSLEWCPALLTSTE